MKDEIFDEEFETKNVLENPESIFYTSKNGFGKIKLEPGEENEDFMDSKEMLEAGNTQVIWRKSSFNFHV